MGIGINDVSRAFIKKTFRNSIQLLCIEMNAELCRFLQNTVFTSSLFTIETESSSNNLNKVLSSSIHHCWLLDLTSSNNKNRLHDVLVEKRYPFCVALVVTIEDAIRAAKAGAYWCYDKNDIAVDKLNLFINDVCSLAALSFLLRGHAVSNGCFIKLVTHFVETPEEWARENFFSFRTLFNLCKISSGMSPKYFLSLYHAIRFTLLCDCLSENHAEYTSITKNMVQHAFFYRKCMEFVRKKQPVCNETEPGDGYETMG